MFKYGGTLFAVGAAFLAVASMASGWIAALDHALAPLTHALGGTTYLEQVLGVLLGH